VDRGSAVSGVSVLAGPDLSPDLPVRKRTGVDVDVGVADRIFDTRATDQPRGADADWWGAAQTPAVNPYYSVASSNRAHAMLVTVNSHESRGRRPQGASIQGACRGQAASGWMTRRCERPRWQSAQARACSARRVL